MGQILPPFSPVLIFFFFLLLLPACTLWQYWSVMKIYKKSVQESSFSTLLPLQCSVSSLITIQERCGERKKSFFPPFSSLFVFFPQFFRRWTFPCLILFLQSSSGLSSHNNQQIVNSDPKKYSKSYLGDGEKIQTFHQRCIILFYSILCYLYGQCSVRYIY